MATFHKGQRVRIKWSLNFPELIGTVGTVMSEADHSSDGVESWIGYDVAPDVWGSTTSPIGTTFSPRGESLAPATDANDKISWEECAWCPEHLRETV